MSCIKTGAYVHLVEYGTYAPADIFLVGKLGDMLIVVFNEGTHADPQYQPLRRVSHTLLLGKYGFYKRDIAVVPADGDHLREASNG